jgi:hypothetical protein
MKNVIILVRDGMAKPQLPLPDGVCLEIRDYDYVEDAQPVIPINDEAGQQYVFMTFAGPGLVDTNVR